MFPSPGLSYLDRVVLEIIETERVYVRDLRMIVQDYLGHIIDQSELSIGPEQVCALFGNIEEIYKFNSELLLDLECCGQDPVEVARCFVLKSQDFEIYTHYCTNYPRSVRVLAEILRDQNLALFFRGRQQLLNSPLPLGSYLLKPVQRVLKYHLLLQEIQNHWETSDDGGDIVDTAVVSMTTVAWFINEMKRRHESSVRVQEVQALLVNWKGPDFTTFGVLVLEGTFKTSRVKTQRNLFLFQKVLLLTKKKGENHVYKKHITCSTLMLIENARDSLSFSITHYKHPKQPITLQARSLEEKQLWAHHIKRIILESHRAVIPQKAQEMFLDQNPFCRLKYGCEERLKTSLHRNA
ncbi:pleckstrin homology domain-containing family G member 3-like [Eucyclogobius newberryi]|uniref:pleckstrin homology domain-containing family G member 3-like n=1 Tax=Eucyclogobius newberryi TaxID=166745 RepID=UPI003B5BABCB